MVFDGLASDKSGKIIHAIPAIFYSILAASYAAAASAPILIPSTRENAVKDIGTFERTKWYFIFLAIMFAFGAISMAAKTYTDLGSYV